MSQETKSVVQYAPSRAKRVFGVNKSMKKLEMN